MTFRPTPAAAAHRRRVLVWFPLFVLGSLVYLAASAAMGMNSLALTGAAAIIGGVVGLALEVGK